jgi:hypothetical protein
MSEPGSTDPSLAAAAFAAQMRHLGFDLDLSVASLSGEVDRLLRSEHFNGHEDAAQWAAEAKLGAYVGEALRLAFDGRWEGAYRDDHAGSNIYTSSVWFGKYRYCPHMFLGYRVSNGEQSMGTFAEHIHKTLPLIQMHRKRGD